MSIGSISGSSDWYSQSAESTQRQKPQQPEMTDTASLLEFAGVLRWRVEQRSAVER